VKLAELGEGRELVVKDPNILSGTPVIRYTRIPVHDVAASVTAGLPMRGLRFGLFRLGASRQTAAANSGCGSPVSGDMAAA
jgi:Protein of unknown function (DUF433)